MYFKILTIWFTIEISVLFQHIYTFSFSVLWISSSWKGGGNSDVFTIQGCKVHQYLLLVSRQKEKTGHLHSTCFKSGIDNEDGKPWFLRPEKWMHKLKLLCGLLRYLCSFDYFPNFASIARLFCLFTHLENVLTITVFLSSKLMGESIKFQID